MDRAQSNRIFASMVILFSLLAGLGVLLPQNASTLAMATSTLPASLPVLAAANAGLVLVV
jgi:hypothetical protein